MATTTFTYFEFGNLSSNMYSIKSASLICALLLTLSLEPSQSQHFTGQLLRQVSRANPEKNFVVSPASTYLALGLIYFGSSSQSASELEPVLESVGRGEILIRSINIANRLYVNNSISILPSYQHLVSNVLGPPAANVNFRNPEEAIEKINEFVREATANKIQHLIDAHTVTNTTQLAIVNAAYFNGFWATPFFANKTRHRPFYSPNRFTGVPTMETDGLILHSILPGFDAQAIELPFTLDNLSLVIILPNDRNDNLGNLSRLLANYDLLHLPGEFKKEFVNLRLPKFNVQFKVPLESVLGPLGVETALTKPQLSKLTRYHNGEVQLATILHESYIEVSEEGFVGANSVAGEMHNFVRSQPNAIEFHANHPFIFVVKNENHVYFVGRVVHLE